MTAPRHRFRTHDRGAFSARQFHQLSQAGAKFFGGHIVGVTAKRSVSPNDIARVRARLAHAAKTGKMRVGKPLCAEGFEYRVAIKLLYARRAWEAAPIHNLFDAVGSQHGHELV